MSLNLIKGIEQLENKVKKQEERINLSITIHEIKKMRDKEIDYYYCEEKEAMINEIEIDKELKQFTLGKIDAIEEIMSVINERRERNFIGGK